MALHFSTLPKADFSADFKFKVGFFVGFVVVEIFEM
jgi:hypothetical protein